VKKLRLTRALTLPEATAVSEACRRMAARRLDAALLTDTNGMLSGIITAEVSFSQQQLEACIFFFLFLESVGGTVEVRPARTVTWNEL
jgi:hypothetical protein